MSSVHWLIVYATSKRLVPGKAFRFSWECGNVMGFCCFFGAGFGAVFSVQVLVLSRCCLGASLGAVYVQV